MRFTRHTGKHTRVRRAIRVSDIPAARLESDFPFTAKRCPTQAFQYRRPQRARTGRRV